MALIMLGVGIGVLSTLAAIALIAWSNARELDHISRELLDNTSDDLRRAERRR